MVGLACTTKCNNLRSWALKGQASPAGFWAHCSHILTQYSIGDSGRWTVYSTKCVEIQVLQLQYGKVRERMTIRY